MNSPVNGSSPNIAGMNIPRDLPQGSGASTASATRNSGQVNIPGMGEATVTVVPVPPRGSEPSRVQGAINLLSQALGAVGRGASAFAEMLAAPFKALGDYVTRAMEPGPKKAAGPNSGATQIPAAAGMATAPAATAAGAQAAIRVSTQQAPPAAQTVVQQEMTELVGGRLREQRHNGVGVGVAQDFWKDLGRGVRYEIAGADGSRTSLAAGVLTGGEAGKHEAMMGAVDAVRQLAGGNELLLQAVTKMASQAMSIGAFVQPFSGPDSPLHLPGGAAGQITPNGFVSSYTLSADGNGGVNVRAEFSIPSATSGSTLRMTAGGPMAEQVALDPRGTFFNASVEINVRLDGNVAQAQVTRPMEFSYAAVLANPTRPPL